MRQWSWTRLFVLAFVSGIAMVILWLFLNFRSHTLEKLNAHQGQFEQNQKVQENLELALNQNDELRRVIQNNLAKPGGLPLVPMPPIASDTEFLAKSRLEAIKNQAKFIEGLLGKAEKEVATWEAYQKSLFQGDAGRRIASDRDQMVQVAGLLEKARPSETLLQAWREQLQNLLDPVARSANDKGLFLPSDGYVQDLARMEQSLKDFVKDFAQDRQILEAILADSQGNKLSDKGLKQATQELTAELAKKRARAIGEVKQAAFDEVTKKLAEAEAHAARVVGEEKAKQLLQKAELETKQLAQQAAIEKARIQAEMEVAKRQADKEKLKRLAEDPTIQRKYQAFLKPGFMQFTNGYLFRQERPEPASFGDMSRMGWLKDSKEFAKGITKQANNDRPTWPYPRTEEEWRVLDLMLEEFRTLGPIWVELKLLRP